ncbi:MAG: PEGA domain-containing protein [Phycisphaerales bacterium]|nr:MAG: PEGA domain-containing protein [Phycisphaerales bacterium]
MTRRRPAALALLCGIAVVMAGCATMISGSSQTITVHSSPPGAYVQIGHQTGTTPVTLHVPKGKDFPVEISQGPDKRVVALSRNLDPITLLNIIPPLWPGFIVDAVTGAITKYDPNVISIDFRTGQAVDNVHLTHFQK